MSSVLLSYAKRDMCFSLTCEGKHTRPLPESYKITSLLRSERHSDHTLVARLPETVQISLHAVGRFHVLLCPLHPLDFEKAV